MCLLCSGLRTESWDDFRSGKNKGNKPAPDLWAFIPIKGAGTLR